MSDVTYPEFIVNELKLRAGPPMPIKGAGTSLSGFVLQTFGVDEYKIKIQPVTETIANGSDFRGQGGEYISASYTRLPDKSGIKFSGRIVYSPVFKDEDVLTNG